MDNEHRNQLRLTDHGSFNLDAVETVFNRKAKARGIRLGRSIVFIFPVAIAPFASPEAAAQRNALFERR